MKKIVLLLCLSVICPSCILGGDINIFDTSVEVNERFFIDEMPNENVDWLFCGTVSDGGEGIVPDVHSVGFNEDYLIAKSSNKYYIIQYKNNADPLKTKIGPLDKHQFEVKRHELGIDTIEFNIHP